MSGDPAAVVHELAVQARKLLEKKRAPSSVEVSVEDCEITRSLLVSRSEDLMKKYPNMTIPQLNRHFHEMVERSI